MSAALALQAARDSGITLGIDGDDLLLEACSEPPAAVIDLLSRHKAEVLEVLAAAEHERNERKQQASETAFEPATLAARDEPIVEQPWAPRRGRVEEHGDLLLHFCVDCGRFGPYGYGVHLGAGQLGRWYCREHRPEDHEPARRSAGQSLSSGAGRDGCPRSFPQFTLGSPPLTPF